MPKIVKRIKEIAKDLAVSFFFTTFFLFLASITFLRVVNPFISKVNSMFTISYINRSSERKIEIDRVKKRLITYPGYGDVFGTISIPRVGIDLAIYHGEALRLLKYGAGHHAGSFFPGEGGRIIIAAHNTYGMFYTLPQVVVGDEVIIKTSYGTYHYKVTKTEIANAEVLANNLTLPTDIENIMLYTCYPLTPGYKSDRFVVYGELVGEEHA